MKEESRYVLPSGENISDLGRRERGGERKGIDIEKGPSIKCVFTGSKTQSSL